MSLKTKTNKDLVSIIMPVYNAEQYLISSISSALNQTYTNLELIIINDGSLDNSSDIIDSISGTDSRIKIVHKCNEGVSKTRNKGLELSKGKYIYFFDADDIMNQRLIETLVDMQESNDELVMCSYFHFDDENQINHLSTDYLSDLRIHKSKDIYNNLFDNGYLWNKLFVKEIIENQQIRFDEEECMLEDQLFVYNYSKFVNKVVICNNVLYYYRNNPSSTVRTKSESNIMSSLTSRYKVLQLSENLGRTNKDWIIKTYNDAIICFLQIKKNIFFDKLTLEPENLKKVKKIGKLLGNKSYPKQGWRVQDYIYLWFLRI